MKSSAMKAMALIVVVAAVYLVGNGRTQLFDRDEPRYAQCSRQMLQSGDWVVPRLYDEIRAKKPPAIYWCQAAAMKLAGDNAFAARLPSAVAMLLTLILLATALWRQVGARQALWTLFIFASSGLTIYAAKVAMTDSVLLFWTTVALLSIYPLWRGHGGWTAVVTLSVAIACAGLVKGPFILGVLGGTIAMLAFLNALDRWTAGRARKNASADMPAVELGRFPLSYQTRPLKEPSDILRKSVKAAVQAIVGLLIVFIIVTPWLYLVYLREPNFIHASTQDALAHMEHGTEGHGGPPGYHLALIWVTFLPWSILLPLAIVLAFKNRADARVRFALAVVLGTWIFVEILPTKLPHYILPAFPALAFLTAEAVVRCLREEHADLKSWQMRMAAVVLSVVLVGVVTAPPWWLAIKFWDYPWGALGALTGFAICIATAISFFFLKKRPVAALLSMGLGSFGTAALLFGLYFPHARPLRLSIQVAAVLESIGAVHPGDALMLDYKEPSLAFYQGGTIREAEHSAPVLRDLRHATPWLVMTRGAWDSATPEQRSHLQIIGKPFVGLNYSDSMRPTEVFVAINKLSNGR